MVVRTRRREKRLFMMRPRGFGPAEVHRRRREERGGGNWIGG
jgi:hypothetical protein